MTTFGPAPICQVVLCKLGVCFGEWSQDSRNRGHEVTLVKDQCRLDIRKHSFSQRTINEWNKLSTDCVTASSMNMFKNKVDTFLRRAGYLLTLLIYGLHIDEKRLDSQ